MQYSEKVTDQFMNPKKVGEIKAAAGVRKVGNPVCGDIMQMFIKAKGVGA